VDSLRSTTATEKVQKSGAGKYKDLLEAQEEFKAELNRKKAEEEANFKKVKEDANPKRTKNDTNPREPKEETAIKKPSSFATLKSKSTFLPPLTQTLTNIH
jgi:hypothetical protein